MSLTEVQLARLTIEIAGLTKKADGLEKKALTQDQDFLDAYKIYGSELAGSSGTEYFYKEARELKERIEFLKKIKSGATPLSDLESLKKRLEEVEKHIQTYTKEKTRLQGILKQFELLCKLLFIEP